MTSRSAPKRRAEKVSPRKGRTPGSVDRPAAEQTHSPSRSTRSSGKRVANHRTRSGAGSRGRRFPALPTPAVVGAMALVVAGVGAIAVSSASPPQIPHSQYQALSADLSGTDLAGNRNDPNTVDVSRDFDRELLAKQTEQQAQQRDAALRDLAAKTEKRAAQLKTNQWVLPVAGYHLTARFGQTSALWATVHTGLDFAAPSGTPIVAVAGGTVKEVSFSGAYGNRTIVTLGDGVTELWYCHQSATKVTPGQKVDPGQLIGYVGSTGNVTGPHLHLEVRPTPDTPVDPEPVLREHGVNP